MPRPLASTLPRYDLLDHDQVLRVLDELLGPPPNYEAVLAASARVDRVLAAGAPGDVELHALSLEVA
jgi:hypothetical protein